MGKLSLNMVKPPYYTLKRAAAMLGVNATSLQRWTSKGYLPSYFEVLDAPDGQTGGVRRGWVRKRDMRINPETGRAFDAIVGKPIYVHINEVKQFLQERIKDRDGIA
jgi:hypothetical protein